MKKLFFTVAIVLAACYSSNAQFFAGGGIGISSGSSKTEGGTNSDTSDSDFNFQFRPKVGYFFSDKFAIGLGLNINPSNSESISNTFNNNTITTTHEAKAYGFTPFVRYYFVKYKSFSVFAAAELTFQSGSSNTKINSTITNVTTITDDPETFNTSFVISPSISYSVTEHFNLEAAINFLNLGLSRTTSEQTSAGVLTKTTTSNANFGAKLDGLMNTSNIAINAIYRF